MIVYGDRTFCPFWRECQEKMCWRALTDHVVKKSVDIGLPIAQYTEKPRCFRDRRELDD